jgi:hypothetical protein
MELAADLRQRALAVPTMAARGGLTMVEEGATRFVRFELLADRRGALSLTILDPLGRPALRTVSDGRAVLALDYRSRAALVGPATEENIRRLLPLGLSVDIVLAALADAPILEPARAAFGRPGSISVASPGPAGEISWTMTIRDSPEGPLLAAQALRSGATPFETAYGTFKPVAVEIPGQAERPFPHLVDVALGDGRRLTFRYDEVRLGVELPAGLFETDVPEGFAPQVL